MSENFENPEIFIKLIKSAETEYLMIHKPNAFRLLTIIAYQARRVAGHPDGLKPGECHIGNLKMLGFSEQNYRTAKQILIKRQHLKISETCRTRKKSTTGTTTVATLVCLISTNVYDLNLNTTNDRPNDCPTTDQRPTNDKLIKNKKEKKEKKINTHPPFLEKIKIRENIMLAENEIEVLKKLHGAERLEEMLDVLDSYKGSSGKEYKSDFFALKRNGWVDKSVNENLKAKELKQVDRRTKTPENLPIQSPADGRF